MKIKTFLVVLLSVLSLVVSADEQKGYVKTKGRLGTDGSVINGERIPNAMVRLKGWNTLLSDSTGAFSFPRTNQSYMLEEVRKNGYALLDPDILQKPIEYTAMPLVIVMENKKARDAERKAWKDKLEKKFEAEVDERNREIERLKAEKKISDDKYIEMAQETSTYEENNEKIVEKILNHLMMTDYDNESERDIEIDTCILGGELDKADSAINAKGLMTKRRDNAQRLIDIGRKELRDIANDCYRKFTICLLRHDNDSAAYYLKFRHETDTTNTQWMLDVGEFLFEYMSDFTTAKGYFEKAKKEAAKQGDAYHEAEACNDLSVLCYILGNRNEALAYIEQSLELIKRAENADSAAVANYYGNIGSVYGQLFANHEKNKEYSQQSLDMYLKLSDAKDKDVVLAYNNVGMASMGLGRMKESEEAWLKGLERGNRLEGKDRDILATIYNNLGHYYQTFQKLDSAGIMFDKARVEWESLYGRRHPKTALVTINTGALYKQLGKYEEGLEMIQRGIETYASLSGENNYVVLNAYINMSEICGSYEERYRQQMNYAQKAMSIARQIYESASVGMAAPYQCIATAYFNQQDYDNALDCYEKVVAVAHETGKGQDVLLAKALNGIARVNDKKRYYDKSIDYYAKSMAVLDTLKEQGGEIYMKKIAKDIITTYNNAVNEKKANRTLRRKVEELKNTYPACFEQTGGI